MKITRKHFLRTATLAAAVPFLPSPARLSEAQVKSKKTATSGTSTQIHVKTVELRLKHAWTLSRNTSTVKNNVFVRLEREGVAGWGEAAPNVRYDETAESTLSAIQQARPIFEKETWWHYAQISDEVAGTVHHDSCAKAALNIALYDWVARKLGVPLYQMLGLDPAKTPVTTFSIGIDTPEVMQQKVREAEEFPVLKIKVGLKNDEDIIQAIRKVTSKPLRVDANEGWKSKEEAVEKINWMATQGIEFVEQPMPASMIEETRWVRERVKLPLIADEAVLGAADIPNLVGAFDGINIKLMKAGGIHEALRMIELARSLRLKIMLGCMIESSVGITAAAHLSPLVDYADLDGNLLISNDPFKGVLVRNGKLILPKRPGLGVTGSV
ncbi:MAG: dipeptide epimerase [Acidobacteriia bacterium]|nr:dipeptide epimerase [Terriglobia bacterium]